MAETSASTGKPPPAGFGLEVSVQGVSGARVCSRSVMSREQGVSMTTGASGEKREPTNGKHPGLSHLTHENIPGVLWLLQETWVSSFAQTK